MFEFEATQNIYSTTPGAQTFRVIRSVLCRMSAITHVEVDGDSYTVWVAGQKYGVAAEVAAEIREIFRREYSPEDVSA